MSDDETTQFGRKRFPQLSFAKSLRTLDHHNGYYPVGFALIDTPGNPRIGLGDDYGAAWDDTKVTDFETYLTTVLKNGADSEKTVKWFQR